MNMKFTLISNDKGFRVLEDAPYLQKTIGGNTRKIRIVDQKTRCPECVCRTCNGTGGIHGGKNNCGSCHCTGSTGLCKHCHGYGGRCKKCQKTQEMSGGYFYWKPKKCSEGGEHEWSACSKCKGNTFCIYKFCYGGCGAKVCNCDVCTNGTTKLV